MPLSVYQAICPLSGFVDVSIEFSLPQSLGVSIHNVRGLHYTEMMAHCSLKPYVTCCVTGVEETYKSPVSRLPFHAHCCKCGSTFDLFVLYCRCLRFVTVVVSTCHVDLLFHRKNCLTGLLSVLPVHTKWRNLGCTNNY